MEVLSEAAALVFTPYVLLVILLSALFGMVVGAIPGLSATMAAALLVPVTFFMDPVPAIGSIVTATAMAIFAGDIPSALIRIPGTPASSAYVDDAYNMTQRGDAALALGAGLVFSALGGLFGTAVLVTSAPQLAEFALNFSSFEYFWLAILGLSCTAIISAGSMLKGAVSLLIGLLLSMVGIGIVGGQPRFTFGSTELLGGLQLVPALVGMFAIPELFRYAVSDRSRSEIPDQRVSGIVDGMFRSLKAHPIGVVRGGAVGVVVGALPGAGAGIAAWIAYAVAKRFSRTPEKFGGGHVEGLAEASAANSSALGGTWVPALVFGIPGDSITAIAIGVLMMKGMTPGPLIFIDTPELVYGVFLVFLVANLFMLPLGYLVIKSAIRLMRLPRDLLMPVVLMFCVVGAFAINNTAFDIGAMLAIGVLAFLMEENGFPVAPAILGLILGKMVEENFILSMAKAQGDPSDFFERPVSAALGVLTLAIWVVPVATKVWRSGRAPRQVPM